MFGVAPTVLGATSKPTYSGREAIEKAQPLGVKVWVAPPPVPVLLDALLEVDAPPVPVLLDALLEADAPAPVDEVEAPAGVAPLPPQATA